METQLVRSGSAPWRLSYLGMAVLSALIVFVGFAPTYFLRALSGAPKPLTALLHVHGLLFTAWIVVFLAQTVLVETGRVHLHRRLGVFGASLLVGMIPTGFLAAIQAARAGHAPPGVTPLAFLAIPLGVLAEFAVLAILGLLWRRRRELHKRLMLLATIALLGPALARTPVVGPWTSLIFDALIVAAAIPDLAARRRPHAVFVYAGVPMIAWNHALPLVAATTAWQVVAAWLVQLRI